MTNKGQEKSIRKVQNLRVKSLAAEKAKQVKGGPCPGTNTNSIRLS